jgi:TPR repeat protein
MKYFPALLLGVLPLVAISQTFDSGWAALLQGHFADSEKTFRQLEQQGDPKGIFGLGVMYQFGYGSVKQDYGTARILYERAAKSNLPAAIQNIGFLHQHGLGVETNFATAVEYYTQSANLGYAVSQHDLAYMYHEGLGVQQDYPKAFALYKQAADSGLPDAIYNVGFMYGRGQGVARNFVASYAYIKAASQLGRKVDPQELAWFETRFPPPDLERANKMAAALTGDLRASPDALNNWGKTKR